MARPLEAVLAASSCSRASGSSDKKYLFERYLREASILPLYDAGNFGMQRRRVHGVMADPSFNPRAIADNEAIEFTKAMEGIDTVPGPRS